MPVTAPHVVGPYDVLGEVFCVESHFEGVLKELDRLLGRFRRPEAAPWSSYELRRDPTSTRRPYQVRRDGTLVHEAIDPRALVDGLLHHAHGAGVASLPPDRVPIHAGAIVTNVGAVLLPGASGAGKTSLVAALARAGHAYATDETAIIDVETGRLRPYPRALRFKPGGLQHAFPDLAADPGLGVDPTRTAHVLPEELGPSIAVMETGSHRVRLVVFPRRGRGGARAEQLTPGTALAELTRHCFDFRSHGDRWLPVLAQVLRGAEALRLEFAEVADAVAAVNELLEKRPTGDGDTT